MRIIYLKLILGVITIAISTSCVKEIDFINEIEPIPVIQCILNSNEEEQKLYLSYTKQKNQNLYPYIITAEVRLYDKTLD